jgi:NADPH-dependent glutamate synthase beta subunit-like oxidoreductase/ferredoxin
LIRNGYEVTVFEKEREAGGLLKFAIPVFRMSKRECDTEIAFLKELGVEFKFNKALGTDFSIDEMADDYDAVIVAVGMGISLTLDVIENNIPASKRNVAIAFLREFNEKTLDIKPAARVLVIGGGNSAVDAARAAKSYDSNNDVVISCIEPLDEMPAFKEEVESAVAEGIRIIDGSDVDECAADGADGIHVTLRSLKGGKETWGIGCDFVVTAIGQRGDRAAIGSAGLKTDGEDRIVTDSASGHTTYKNVFAAGDICGDNHVSLIGAIASGKKAAVGVRQLLEAYSVPYEGREALDVLNASDMPGWGPAPDRGGRFDEARIFEEMRAFDIVQACAKCDHCIDNFGCPALIRVRGKVTVDDYQCTRCGLCIDVCVNQAIHWA